MTQQNMNQEDKHEERNQTDAGPFRKSSLPSTMLSLTTTQTQPDGDNVTMH